LTAAFANYSGNCNRAATAASAGRLAPTHARTAELAAEVACSGCEEADRRIIGLVDDYRIVIVLRKDMAA
jgi:hypothetical protein